MKSEVIFTEFDRLKAMAVVNIFETGRPFGEYSALAVLNDGAGLSYGISQFTHRSGSLHSVVRQYLKSGGRVGRGILIENLITLRSTSASSIVSASQNGRLKNALRAAAVTHEMRAAQHEVAFERYLRPAIEACAGSGFVHPLSLAVIYDSINHGSWEMIRDRVRLDRLRVPAASFEKRWITEYVKQRHAWLRGVPRLRSTSYRTAFFLAQIIAGNWDLRLPVTVHGFSLSIRNFPPDLTGETASAAGHHSSADDPNILPETSVTERGDAFPADVRPPKNVRRIGEELSDALARYDRFESVIRTILTRTDAAKSLWTTVAGTLWQTFWAVVSFVIGMPREVWLAVAIIAGVLTVLYLYRQFALGRIREMHGLLFLAPHAERHNDSAQQNNE
ncbi:MAG: chitosanase [Pyrinomonadaceae bacterium]